MTPADLRAWQASVGLTAPKAAAALGVSYATYRDWLAGTSRTTGKGITLPPMLGLACAAIAQGIAPL
jgi:DNA-binding transcriptional regulator YiaG